MLAESRLKDISRKAEKRGGEDERYVLGVIPTIEASLRSLDIIHKGRQLNFAENAKLRSAYLSSIEDSLNFGAKAQDFVKALPTMTIAGTTGTMLLSQSEKWNDTYAWLVGLLFAAIGYFINLYIIRFNRKRKQKYYVVQDYERTLYYEQYISRASIILKALYLELDNIHKNIFGEPYPIDKDADALLEQKDVVERLLAGVRTTYCKYIHTHMREDKINVDLWAICEAGNDEAQEKCPFWH